MTEESKLVSVVGGAAGERICLYQPFFFLPGRFQPRIVRPRLLYQLAVYPGAAPSSRLSSFLHFYPQRLARGSHHIFCPRCLMSLSPWSLRMAQFRARHSPARASPALCRRKAGPLPASRLLPGSCLPQPPTAAGGFGDGVSDLDAKSRARPRAFLQLPSAVDIAQGKGSTRGWGWWGGEGAVWMVREKGMTQ